MKNERGDEEFLVIHIDEQSSYFVKNDAEKRQMNWRKSA
jgi:hypothetical protein